MLQFLPSHFVPPGHAQSPAGDRAMPNLQSTGCWLVTGEEGGSSVIGFDVLKPPLPQSMPFHLAPAGQAQMPFANTMPPLHWAVGAAVAGFTGTLTQARTFSPPT